MDKFQGVQRGTLVKRSAHWYSVHKTWPRGQLGIVIDRNVYQEGDRLVTFPVIQWEGEVSSSGTHPDNADVAPSKYRAALARRR
jgi:hypothetical protein